MKLFPITCEYISGEKQFYYRAQRFYEDVPASEEGMMGDFVDISNVDLEGSRQFLKRFVVSILVGSSQVKAANRNGEYWNFRLLIDKSRN